MAIRPPGGRKKRCGSLARATRRGETIDVSTIWPQTQRFVRFIYPAVSDLDRIGLRARCSPPESSKLGLNAVMRFLRPDPDAGDEDSL